MALIKSLKEDCEPEIELYFCSRADSYMIIKLHKGQYSFQRCGGLDMNGELTGSGETYYDSLEELCSTPFEDLILEKEWDDIYDVLVNDCFSIRKGELDEIIEHYGET